jgi:hypothetical protein
MTEQKPADREETRESLNTMRIVGGLLIIAAMLVFFFHLAEARFGQITLGAVAAALGLAGVVMIFVGWSKLRALG